MNAIWLERTFIDHLRRKARVAIRRDNEFGIVAKLKVIDMKILFSCSPCIRGCLRWLVIMGLIWSRPVMAQDEVTAVLTLERYSIDRYFPAYRLDIFPDGKVIYEGRQRVQIEGYRVIRVPKERVTTLFDALRKEEFFSIPTQDETERTDRRRMATIVADLNGTRKQVTFFTNARASQYERMLYAIEGLFPTRGLRCPYWPNSVDPKKVAGGEGEVCAYQDDNSRHFRETYK